MCQRLFLMTIFLLYHTIFYAQIDLSIGKAGFSIGNYKNTDSVKTDKAWGVNLTYEHFKVNHLSWAMNISTFSTHFTKYNPKKKIFENVNDLLGNIEVDTKYYPFKITNSLYLGAGIGAHICDCYSFNSFGKYREGVGGFDFHIKLGYQFIVNEKIALNLGYVYSFVRPGKRNYLEKHNALLQLGFVID